MRLVKTTLALLAAWILLSGSLSPFYLAVGLATSVVVALNFIGWQDDTRFRPLRFLAYLPWLAFQVVKSNLRIARCVLSPRMPIEPTFICQPPGVRGDRALTTLGAGITLTPGTLTVDVSEQEVLVHALDRASADDVRSGIMARRVAPAFTEASS